KGMASKDIADRLFLSVRTVSNHLQNAYTKLGVTSRAGLAQALGSTHDAGADHSGPAVLPAPRPPAAGPANRLYHSRRTRLDVCEQEPEGALAAASLLAPAMMH